MKKPTSIKRHELIEDLARIINKSDLPLIIIEPIIKNLFDEIQKALRQQEEADRVAYNQYLAEQAEKEQSEGGEDRGNGNRNSDTQSAAGEVQ